MKALRTKHIAKILDEDPGTLRQWFLEIERAGYMFKRSGKHRRFFDEDVNLLKEFKRLKEDEGFTIEEAALSVATRWGKRILPNTPPSNVNDILEEAHAHLSRAATLLISLRSYP